MAKHYHTPVRVSPGKDAPPVPADQCRCAETVPQMVHLCDGQLAKPEEIKTYQVQELRHVTFADPHCPYCDGTGTTVRTELTTEIVKEKIVARLERLAGEIKHQRVWDEVEAVKALFSNVC